MSAFEGAEVVIPNFNQFNYNSKAHDQDTSRRSRG